MTQDIPRNALRRTLRPLLPTPWKIISGHQKVDNISVPIVKLKQRTIERHPTAPASRHLIGFTITIDASGVGLTQAVEDELDDNVNDLLHAFDRLGLLWTKAEKVADDNRLAYDVDVQIASNPDN